MTSPILSVLDPSPIFETRSSREALLETRALAEATDQMGYRAYWVQEHHNTQSFAGTAPEILIADLAARTQNLKIGSGGVMLPNYSPLKVAEQFALLSALHPGRIELGLGRATGADPRASAALLGPGAQEFPQMLNLLLGWLLDTSGEKPLALTHPASGIGAHPRGYRPDVWMLSSSPQSAAYAGSMGLKLAFADFLSPGGAAPAIGAYRNSFRPSAFTDTPHAAIGIVALAAPTQDEAAYLAATLQAWSLGLSFRQGAPFKTVEDAQMIVQAAPAEALAAARARAIIGDPKHVTHALKQAAHTANANELLILTVAQSTQARIRSYQLIAEEFARYP